MVTKYDLLYSVYSNEGLAANELVKKLGKKQEKFPVFYKHLRELEDEKYLTLKDKKYFLKKEKKTIDLLHLIDFCVRNKIDYNQLFLPKTIEFIKEGLENNEITGKTIDNKTRARIVTLLEKQGFIIVDSKRPFKARIVYSDFLEKLTKYFVKEIKINGKRLHEYIDEKKLDSNIEKEFSKYKKQTKTFSIDEEINFIHRSLSLEGNTLTLPETEQLIKRNIPPKGRTFKEMQETTDYKKAVEQLINDKNPLTLKRVLEFHKVAMNSMEKSAGEIRQQKVQIKGNPNFKTANWKEIPSLLKEIFYKYSKEIEEKIKAKEAIELATKLHADFQWTHPFVDGNSRTSRAIFQHTLMLAGFPLIQFSAGFTKQYMEQTKLSQKRNDTTFTLLMKQICLHSLKQTNKKIKYS
jgi:fido (protein-threonine AMPylation protein)